MTLQCLWLPRQVDIVYVQPPASFKPLKLTSARNEDDYVLACLYFRSEEPTVGVDIFSRCAGSDTWELFISEAKLELTLIYA